MINYDVIDVLEFGDGTSLIRDKETINVDEVSGSWGPLTEELESE
jgi:hypothetical protein